MLLSHCFSNRQTETSQLTLCVSSSNLVSSPAAGGAPEGPPAPGLPAAESGSAGPAAAEAVGSGEELAGAGVSAPEAGSAAAQPQAALLPQTVASGMQERRRVEGRPGGKRAELFEVIIFKAANRDHPLTLSRQKDKSSFHASMLLIASCFTRIIELKNCSITI